jgi:hypothetical protein
VLGRKPQEKTSLRHLLVAGGSIAEWAAFTDIDWQGRLEALADIAQRGGAQFVTVHPHEMTDASPPVASDMDRLRRRIDCNGVSIVIDPVVDGRDRIIEVASSWSGRRGLTEERLSRALFGEAGEPDLVVILGPSHRLPRSLVWELAYGELVFLPVTWGDLAVEHLRTAVDDFARRQRRFGGVD